MRKAQSAHQKEEVLIGGGRTLVTQHAGTVYRASGPQSQATLALLKHLENVGYPYAPRVIGTGFDQSGRETLGFIEGDVHPQPWREEAFPRIGIMLKELHAATASFRLPDGATWREWYGRELGGSKRVIGHCDTGPWNIVARRDLPMALIDWEEAGPVDAVFELAQACWLNAQLYDDDLAEKLELGSANQRAKQVRLLLDGYELPQRDRKDFADELLRCALLDAASEAVEARITEETRGSGSLWAVTWRTRSAAWILRNKALLEQAFA